MRPVVKRRYQPTPTPAEQKQLGGALWAQNGPELRDYQVFTGMYLSVGQSGRRCIGWSVGRQVSHARQGYVWVEKGPIDGVTNSRHLFYVFIGQLEVGTSVGPAVG